MKQQSHKEMFQLLQDAIWSYGDIYSLSIETGISTSTLYKYRREGHKFPWPRFATWQALMKPLKLRLTLSHEPNKHTKQTSRYSRG